MSSALTDCTAWILDLDGVVWLGDAAIPGSADAIARLAAAGRRVLFLTNNSSATLTSYVEKLARHAIKVTPDQVCSSAMAAARCVRVGERVLMVSGDGAKEAVRAAGAVCVEPDDAGDWPDVDAVMVGWHRTFDYARLTAAYRAVARGARLIGTNDDATYPSAEGELPGGGALLAAVRYAAGVEPLIAGKPHRPAAELVLERLGLGADPTPAVRRSLVMVGDRLSTDGEMAGALGARFGLVLTGVTRRDDAPYRPAPDAVADDLAAMVDAALG